MVTKKELREQLKRDGNKVPPWLQPGYKCISDIQSGKEPLYKEKD